MNGSAAIDYADWKAPAEDGGLIIWPEPGILLREARENNARLGEEAGCRVQNVPLGELRGKQREWIGHKEAGELIFATGHQAELYHPGVWVKNAMIDAAAAKAGGAAYHFSVDTDEPKHLHLRWPGEQFPITDDPALTTAAWTALLDGPTPAHVQRLQEAVGKAEANWSFKTALGRFLESLKKLSLEPTNLPTAVTNSTHELEWGLGLRHHAMVTSPIWMAPPCLVFVHHILARADGFAADYNAALAWYRRENKVKSTTRPMPDLKVTAEACEVPFWLDCLKSGTRTRANVVKVSGQWVLRHGEEAFAFDPAAEGWGAAEKLAAWLRGQGLRLSPRALTLTTFLRLFVADQFTHGIGGGRYDQVTDRLIESHLGIAAPRFSVTTATMYFPAAIEAERVCAPCLSQEGHRLKHGLLGEEKRQLVAAIAAAPRKSMERRVLFGRMHERLSNAVKVDPRMGAWEQRRKESEEQMRTEAALFDRELFFAVQPVDRLNDMIERYREAFASA